MENTQIKHYGKRWYKRKRWWFIGILLVAVVIAAVIFTGGEDTTYESIVVQRGDLIQEVSVTGKVRPAQSVDLQFESSGRVGTINYEVGDVVNAGATIVSLENQDLQAAVTSARADLEKVKKDFESLSDPEVYSSLRVELNNAQNNLNQVKIKADGDLATDYNSAFNTMQEAMTQLDTSSVVLEYLRKTHLEAQEPWDSSIKAFQSEVSSKTANVRSSFPAIDQPGVTITPSLYSQIDSALTELLTACRSLRNAFTYLQDGIQKNSLLISSATDRTSVNTEATAISSDISDISNAIQNITDQKITNSKNISDAEAKLATAQAAFPTNEDILQKEASLLSAQASLRKTLIVAPFRGVVGKINVERGQTVTSSTVIASLISDAEYQVEANITEIDISKVKVGDSVSFTLDAYGPEIVFYSTIASIDPGETVIDGVTTYKTTINITDEGDLFRSNMTANIDIETGRKTNVISVPQRSVIIKNGNKIVRVLRNGFVTEVSIVTGIVGQDGLIEVIQGLNEGDRVITFIND